jgi:phage major head subunit gpT-like protein
MAGGTITTGNVSRLLQEGLNSVFGQAFAEHSPQWNQIFDTFDSAKNFEIDQQFEGFALASVKLEGDSIPYDTQTEGFTPKYPNLTYGKGFIVTEEALEDEQYGVFSRRARSLAFSINQTKEVVGANVLNEGFNAAFTMQDGDGKELFSTAHPNGPTDSGSFSNKLAVDADLTEASLEDLLIQINQATDPRGLRIALQGVRLIVPPALMFVAERILASTLQNDTANNAVNAVKAMSSLRDGYTVNNFLTDSDAWFIKTNAPDGMKYFNRRGVRFEQDMDFGTSNMRFKATERYSFGWSDARGIYGSQGAG